MNQGAINPMTDELTQSFNPARRDFSPYGLTCVTWQASFMPRPDHHNEIEINFLTYGEMTYLHGGRKVTIHAGSLALFWAGMPHQIIHFTDNLSYFVATIPLHNFLEWKLPEDFVQYVMQGNLVDAVSTQLATDAELFERWIKDLANKERTMSPVVMLEMQARISRLAMDYRLEKQLPNSGKYLARSLPNLSKVEQMACFIAQNYTQKLNVQQISEQVNLHPAYAMNLFQKTFGVTLIQFLTQHRIAHAQRMLTTSATSITHIALQSGFTSISRFNEAFLEFNGCSPRDYRKGNQI